MPPSRAAGTKRRAPTACRFCRQRKMKCNNKQPACGNCIEYDKVCIYEERPKRPRPSHSRIAALEEENRRLHEAVGSLQSSTSPRDVTIESDQPFAEQGLAADREPLSQTQQHLVSPLQDSPIPGSKAPSPTRSSSLSPPPAEEDTWSPAIQAQEQPRLPPAASAHGASTHYHGPTSTLFDDSIPREARAQRVALQGQSRGPSIWAQKALLAEAASQRQLEAINLAQGKLDFDGVDPDLGMHLLQLHWNRQHHSFLITYRPAFMRDMACGGPYFSKLLLNAIFFGASKFSNRPEVRRNPNDVRTAGWLFRERVRALLGGALDKSDITTIQALLVMTSSLFALGDERSAAWLYAGTAFRMIIDLGLHVDAERMSMFRHLTDEDHEIRRRVFWGAFVVDKIQSLYQGRPVSLQEMDHSVPLAFLDEYEELEHWQPFAYPVESVANSYPGSPAYSVSCFTQLCKLSLIMTRILNRVYAERSSKKGSKELTEDFKSLSADLKAWRSDLPSHLTFDPGSGNASSERTSKNVTPPPHVLSLLAMYNVLLILLHRPFVSDGHLHANMRALAASSFLTCTSAASTIVELLKAYDEAYSIRRAPYLISYATYVAATIHVRMAAQKGNWAKDAKQSLAVCLRVFEKNQGTNWAVRRARTVIGGLMERMNITIDLRSTGSKDGDTPIGHGLMEQASTTGDEMAEELEASTARSPVQREQSAMVNRSQEDDSASRRAGGTKQRSSNGVDETMIDIDAVISSFLDPGNTTAPNSMPTTQLLSDNPGPFSYSRQHSYVQSQPPAGVLTAYRGRYVSDPWLPRNYGAEMTPSITNAVSPSLHRGPLPAYLPPYATNASLEGSNNPSSLYSIGARGSVHTNGEVDGAPHSLQVGTADGIGGGFVNSIDMLFGFNSSAMEGMGWEFENAGR